MMRMLVPVLLLLAGFISASAQAMDVQGRYRIAPESVIRFSVAQMGGAAIAGTFTRFAGTFVLDGKDLSGSKVEFSLAPDGVQAADPRVEEFIRSEAVFDVARYPIVTFRSNRVIRTGDQTARIDGRLTAKGHTNSVSFDITFTGQKGKALQFHVTGKMSRALFGMDVGTPVFSNMVVLDMDLVGRRS